MSKPKVRSEAYKERRRAYDRARRKREREAAGGKSRAEWLAFVKEQAAKTKAARTAVVVQPSVAKRQAVQANTGPGETVEQFLARGGKVERIPGYSGTIYTTGIPARHFTSKGAHAA